MTSLSHVCPVCGQSHAADARVCAACGLIFASYGQQAQIPSPATAPPLLALGQTLAKGRYTVQRPLSEGGMGTLYLATDHEAFERTVVVKVLRTPADSASNAAESFRTRFAQEARTLATLSYPTIPQIFAYFQDGPHTCIVMAYIAGRDLEGQLTHVDATTGALRPGRSFDHVQVLGWGIELCRMLEYMAAHQPPVVHHDIKPANLVLSSVNNHLFLVDFGTAVAHVGAHGNADEAYGTPGYAPPEQYRGQSEPRSDIYALAATLYHLASDDDPTQHRFVFSHLDQLGALGQVLRQALDTDVAKRPSALELRQQLERLHAIGSARLLHTPSGHEVRNPRGLVAWCAANWSAAIPWLYGSLPAEVEATWNPDLARELRGIVRSYVDRNAGLDAALALLDPVGFGAQQPQLIVNKGAIDFGTFGKRASNTQQFVLTNTGRRYAEVTLDLPPWITTATQVLGLPPGQQITTLLTAQRTPQTIVRQLDDAVLVRTSVSAPLQVRARATLPSASRWFRPVLILLIMFVLAAVVPALLIITMSEPIPSVNVWNTQAVATLMPLVAHSQPIISPTRPPTAQPTTVVSLHTLDAGSTVWNVTWSPDGTLLASVGRDGAIRIWSASDSKQVEVLKGYGDWQGSVAWSPDSETIASGSEGNRIVLRHVRDNAWRRNLDGSSATVLSVAWSPDGTTLASGSADGSIRLWRMSDGVLLRELTGHTAEVQSIAFSPDGTMLVSGSQDRTARIWRVSDGAPLRILSGHRGAVLSAAWSPDGTLLASGSEDHTVMLWSASDGKQQATFTVSQRGISSLAWSPDGHQLAFGGEDKQVWMWQVGSDAAPTPILNVQQRVFSLAWNPDAHALAVGGDDGKIQFWAVP